MSAIDIRNARVNNLKGVSLQVPHNKLIVVAGVSGSGKSSLAFDTLYAEGQRRYVESLSSYARQFLGRIAKPECDFITGLPPAIAIEQKTISRNSRSTVGTTTEIYDYMRMLFARIGKTISPISGQVVTSHTIEDVIACMQQQPEGTTVTLLSPIHVRDGLTLGKVLELKNQQGFNRIYCHGSFYRIADLMDDENMLNGLDQQNCFAVVDRISATMDKGVASRMRDSVETAYFEGDGFCRLICGETAHDFSTRFEADDIMFEVPTDQMFSFNSPTGACPECEGFGKVMGIDEKLVIPNTSLSVYDGCVQCWHGEKMGMWKDEFCRRAAKHNFPIFTPYFELTQKEKDWLWYGLPSDLSLPEHERVSINNFFNMVKENQYKIQYRVMLSRYRGKTECPSCRGTRLRKEALWVKVGGRNIAELITMHVGELREWFAQLQLDSHDAVIGKRMLTEIKSRLEFLHNVGLDYLTINRPSNTLSGGESQRINLCTSLGSSLIGSLYILDEPSIGLHSHDTQKLINVLRQLQQIGNTVVVVEHDEEMMRAADHIIDVGPDAGVHGGRIVFNGSTDILKQDRNVLLEKYPDSHTIQYLTHNETIDTPASRRSWNRFITVKKPRMNNLKGMDVNIPLNVMTVVTGVSGSGKSSLVKGILYPALKRHLNEVCDAPGEYAGLDGDWQAIEHVEMVDQNPIGKSTRSNPATYMKAYDAIRQLFGEQQLSRQMGFSAQHFSFNAEGGRCEECKGAGTITVEMQFMADLELTCEHCHGRRFKSEVLDVKFQGKSIYDVLEMSVSEAIAFFKEHKQKTIVSRLQPLEDVGLGYIKLGQSSSTLSGGENQRVKLAYYISQERQAPTLFIFDEPTTGLHFHDIKRLLQAFNAIIERGHTILVIEHNTDVIRCADHIIDLGPGGGNDGGNIVATGTPEEVAKNPASLTGKYIFPQNK